MPSYDLIPNDPFRYFAQGKDKDAPAADKEEIVVQVESEKDVQGESSDEERNSEGSSEGRSQGSSEDGEDEEVDEKSGGGDDKIVEEKEDDDVESNKHDDDEKDDEMGADTVDERAGDDVGADRAVNEEVGEPFKVEVGFVSKILKLNPDCLSYLSRISTEVVDYVFHSSEDKK